MKLYNAYNEGAVLLSNYVVEDAVFHDSLQGVHCYVVHDLEDDNKKYLLFDKYFGDVSKDSPMYKAMAKEIAFGFSASNNTKGNHLDIQSVHTLEDRFSVIADYMQLGSSDKYLESLKGMPNVKYLLVEWIYNAVKELSLCEAYKKVKIVSPIDFRMLNNDPTKLIFIPFGSFVAKSNEEACLDSHFAKTLRAIMRRTDIYVEDLVRLADELKEHSQTHQQVLDRLGKLMKLYKMSVDAN